MISSQWIITAAHCVYNSIVGDTIIRLGEWNIKSDHGHEDFEVEEIQVYQNYNERSFKNDIGVFHFQPFEFYFCLF